MWQPGACQPSNDIRRWQQRRPRRPIAPRVPLRRPTLNQAISARLGELTGLTAVAATAQYQHPENVASRARERSRVKTSRLPVSNLCQTREAGSGVNRVVVPLGISSGAAFWLLPLCLRFSLVEMRRFGNRRIWA